MHNRPQNASLDHVPIADIILEYYNAHGSTLPSASSIKTSCYYWVEFFKTASVAEATEVRSQEKFLAWMQDRDFSTAYTQRVFGVGKAALNRAFRRGEISSMPYMISIKVNYGAPQGRPLKIDEMARLLNSAPDHLRLFMLIMIGTACRPDAALSLCSEQLDFENRLIDLNPAGRAQTKKHRPVVKMPETLATILNGAPTGPVITYRGKQVESVKTSWRNLRAELGFDEKVTPYSIRHTMARYLRSQGVSAWEVASQLGHKSREYRTTELYAPFDPSYLSDANQAIERYFDQLRANCVPLDQSFFHIKTHQPTGIKEFFGAGDEHRMRPPVTSS